MRIHATLLFLSLAFLIAEPTKAADNLFPYDQSLEWHGERHGTLGSTGNKLFADELKTAPGFLGLFGLCRSVSGFRDPVILRFRELDGGEIPLVSEKTVWRPSFQEEHWTHPKLKVIEKKCILEADALLDYVELCNCSDESLDVEVCLEGKNTKLLAHFLSKMTPVDLQNAANVVLRVDGSLELLPQDKSALALGAGAFDVHGLNYGFRVHKEYRQPIMLAVQSKDSHGSTGSFPERARFDIPETEPGLVHLNLLFMMLAVGQQNMGDDYFEVRMHLDDGTEERIPWPPDLDPAGPNPRMEWTSPKVSHLAGLDLKQLSYTPPPGRMVESAELVKDAGEGVSLLLSGVVESPPKTGRPPILQGSFDYFGAKLSMILLGDGFSPCLTPDGGRGLHRRFTMAPGETIGFNVLLATGNKQFGTMMRAQQEVADPNLISRHQEKYNQWFEENAPRFVCSDPMMEKAWKYRWFLARHTLSRLDLPRLTLPVFFESRHGGDCDGITTLSTPHILAEARWLADPEYAQGQIRALLRNRLPNDLLPDLFLGTKGIHSMHWIPAAAFEAYKVNGSKQYLKEVTSRTADCVSAWCDLFDKDGDHLPEVGLLPPSHVGLMLRGALAVTDEKDLSREIERPDLAAALYASARAVAESYALLDDDEDSQYFNQLADSIRKAMLDSMWRSDEKSFFAVRADGNDTIPQQDISSAFPLFIPGLTPDEADSIQTLSNLSGLPAIDLPCAYTRCILTETLALAERQLGSAKGKEITFSDFLSAYTSQHFENGDPNRCILYDDYTPEAGRERGALDAFRSTYNDLIIRFVAGIVPHADGSFELWPLETELDYFRVEGIPYHGKKLIVTWDPPDDKSLFAPTPEGYSLSVDGEVKLHSTKLERLR